MLQYKSDGSGNKEQAQRKRDRKKLKKLKENSWSGFFSCDSQDGVNELVLSQAKAVNEFNANSILQVKDATSKQRISDSQRISASQNRRQRENELEEIDSAMDKLVAQMSAEFDSVSEDKSQSPT